MNIANKYKGSGYAAVIVLIFIAKLPFLFLFHGGLNVVMFVRSFHMQ